MLTVTILKGLPASGKTTWAKEQIANAPVNSIKRINKDDMRAMIDAGIHSKGNEKLVLALRNTMIILFLNEGKHVIVDDTNLASYHEQDIRKLVKESGIDARVDVKMFEATVEECIARDYGRDNPVGEKVIRTMYNKFMKKIDIPKYREHVHGRACVICDIDGTLARMDNRGPFEFDKVGEDGCHAHIAEILDRFHAEDCPVILLSGRGEEYRHLTVDWLEQFDIPYQALYMRPAGDNRCDTVIKRELFEKHIEPFMDVHFVIDDRNRVVDLWRRELKIPCLQAYYGDF